MIAVAKHFIIGLLRLFCRQAAGGGSFLIPAYAGLGNFLMMTPIVRSWRAASRAMARAFAVESRLGLWLIGELHVLAKTYEYR